MSFIRINTQIDQATARELDDWRAALTPQPSRAEAAALLLKEALCNKEPMTIESSKTTFAKKEYPSADHLAALFVLEGVSGFGPVKFRTMHDAAIDPISAIENPEKLPFTGRTGEKLKKQIAALTDEELTLGRDRATNQLERAEENAASILVHGSSGYPDRVYSSNNPVPVLYVRGDHSVWEGRNSVAVVGSRNTREPYKQSVRVFATVAAKKDIVVVSGFALGADSFGHMAAFESSGKTICVMPCGLDKVFPPENRDLWLELLAYPGAVFVSEFGFGQRTSSLLLRKRNKLIVAFSQGVLVAQSAENGGAMNAYRFAREQKKPVATFKSDGLAATSGNKIIEKDDRTGRFSLRPKDDESNYQAWLDQLSYWT